MKASYHDNWGRGRELFTKTIGAVRRLASWFKHRWMHWGRNKVHEIALDRYYAAEYKHMSESIRRDRIARDIIKMHSQY